VIFNILPCKTFWKNLQPRTH